jgi:hypothetical protein
MNKYQKYLEEKHSESQLLNELFNQVEAREFEKAYGTAMRIKAIKDIKWELLKIDDN